ncbi:hypothetical protein GYB22_05475 [bacterium]|nr:hypothetical protein [bacterium]
MRIAGALLILLSMGFLVNAQMNSYQRYHQTLFDEISPIGYNHFADLKGFGADLVMNLPIEHNISQWNNDDISRNMHSTDFFYNDYTRGKVALSNSSLYGSLASVALRYPGYYRSYGGSRLNWNVKANMNYGFQDNVINVKNERVDRSQVLQNYEFRTFLGKNNWSVEADYLYLQRRQESFIGDLDYYSNIWTQVIHGLGRYKITPNQDLTLNFSRQSSSGNESIDTVSSWAENTFHYDEYQQFTDVYARYDLRREDERVQFNLIYENVFREALDTMSENRYGAKISLDKKWGDVSFNFNMRSRYFTENGFKHEPGIRLNYNGKIKDSRKLRIGLNMQREVMNNNRGYYLFTRKNDLQRNIYLLEKESASIFGSLNLLEALSLNINSTYENWKSPAGFAFEEELTDEARMIRTRFSLNKERRNGLLSSRLDYIYTKTFAGLDNLIPEHEGALIITSKKVSNPVYHNLWFSYSNMSFSLEEHFRSESNLIFFGDEARMQTVDIPGLFFTDFHVEFSLSKDQSYRYRNELSLKFSALNIFGFNQIKDFRELSVGPFVQTKFMRYEPQMLFKLQYKI